VNSYALRLELLQLLDRHGLVLEDLHVSAPRKRFLAPRAEPDRLQITIVAFRDALRRAPEA
jgi:hypothetical protein